MFRKLSSHPKAIAAGVAAVSGSYWFLTRSSKRTGHVVVVGGGTAGIGVSAMLRNDNFTNITVIEPKDVHYYQPLWTLVGGGVKNVEQSQRPMTDILPSGTEWIQKKVASFAPDSNEVELDDGSKIKYDYMVVASGIQIDFDKVKGLPEALEKEDSGVVSIYDYKYADKTWKTFERVRNSKENPKFLFTMSPTPIKCAGAPQKIMYLMEDTMAKLGARATSYFGYWTPGKSMFGVPYYSQKLEKIRQDRHIDAKFQHELISIDVPNQIATFKNKDTNQEVKESFDLLHVAPHMSAPDFLKQSPISDDKGFVDVDKHTLQSKRYANIFALGDCANTPNSKTAAAITSQAPVVVQNLKNQMDEKPLLSAYQGYASCPLIIKRGQTILAEFGYGGKLMETFGPTGSFPLRLIGTEGYAQQRFFYFLKEQLFPFVYWNLWTRGMWYGTSGPFKPGIRDDPTIKKDALVSGGTIKK